MQINTDTTVIHGLIQAELDIRWKNIVLNSQTLPFTNTRVIQTKDVGRFVYADFAKDVIQKLVDSQ